MVKNNGTKSRTLGTENRSIDGNTEPNRGNDNDGNIGSTIEPEFIQDFTEIIGEQAQTKKRGRPKGSKNKNKSTTNTSEETADFSEETVKGLGSVKVKSKKRVMDSDDANKITEFILTTVQNLAVQSLGNDAAMNMIEITLLGTSLPKLLTSLEVSTVERMSGVLYPIMGIMGVGLYGLRIASLYKVKNENEAQNTTNQQTPTQNNETNQNMSSETSDNSWITNTPKTPSIMMTSNLP